MIIETRKSPRWMFLSKTLSKNLNFCLSLKIYPKVFVRIDLLTSGQNYEWNYEWNCSPRPFYFPTLKYGKYVNGFAYALHNDQFVKLTYCNTISQVLGLKLIFCNISFKICIINKENTKRRAMTLTCQYTILRRQRYIPSGYKMRCGLRTRNKWLP